MREREARKAAGINVDDEEEEEDFMGVGPLIEKLEKKNFKDHAALDEPTDSDSEEDDEDDMRRSDLLKDRDQFEKKCKRHKVLLDQFIKTGTSFLYF